MSVFASRSTGARGIPMYCRGANFILVAAFACHFCLVHPDRRRPFGLQVCSACASPCLCVGEMAHPLNCRSRATETDLSLFGLPGYVAFRLKWGRVSLVARVPAHEDDACKRPFKVEFEFRRRRVGRQGGYSKPLTLVPVKNRWGRWDLRVSFKVVKSINKK